MEETASGGHTYIPKKYPTINVIYHKIIIKDSVKFELPETQTTKCKCKMIKINKAIINTNSVKDFHFKNILN